MKTALVTSFDENYFKYSMVLLKTLSQNYFCQDPLDVICLVPGELLTKEKEYVAALRAANLNVSFRSSNKYEDLVRSGRYTFNEFPHITSNALQRLFLASTLHEYSKAIYLDPDTIILRDIQPLLDYPLHGKIAAYQEPDHMNLRTFKTLDRPYFNNGVFITDLEYWRQVGLEEEMVSWISTNELTPIIEQDVMNRFLFPVWSPLPQSFNFFDQNGDEVLGDGPLLVHFIGEGKPWVEGPTETAWRRRWIDVYQNM
jgi:lipopolysaccharide biosynthesis glycosyltransferase